MLPVIALGPQPGDACLDMCAAPGSKTTQVAEALDCGSGDFVTSDPGIVIASDVCADRARILAKRCAALGAICQRVLVVNHRAQTLPSLRACGRTGFDRIICDVPCSGDGTLRKDKAIWGRWRPSFGTSLHSLQLQIALRGAAVLAVGGMMAYSTCTFNPVENEAVVAALLRASGGALELINLHEHEALQHVKCRSGMQSWRVASDDLTWLETFEDSQRVAPKHERGWFRRSMWPSRNADDPAHAQLARCIRLLPHLENTGGFFISLIRKVAPLPSGRRETIPRSPGLSRSTSTFDVVPRSVLVQRLVMFDLSPKFFSDVAPTLIGRGPTFTVIYVAAPAVAKLVAQGDSESRSGHRVVNAGAKCFDGSDRRYGFAPTRLGLRILCRYAQKSVAVLTRRDLRAIVTTKTGFPVTRLRDESSSTSLLSLTRSGPCLLTVNLDSDSATAYGIWEARSQTVFCDRDVTQRSLLKLALR